MSRDRRRLLARWGAVLAWMLLIFCLSSIPDVPDQPGLPRARDRRLDDALHSAGHIAEYGVLTVLAWRAASAIAPGLAAYPWAAAWALAYGASDEFHQSFVAGRTCSLHDWLVDASGVALVLLCLVARRATLCRTRQTR